MKKREKEIIVRLLNKKSINFNTLLNDLKISRRTLYYDIEKINLELTGIGSIIKNGKDITIIGDFNKIQNELNPDDKQSFDCYLKYSNRRSYILEKVLNGNRCTTDSLAKDMYVSTITIKDTIKRLKEELLAVGVYITYQKGYNLTGSEKGIRNLFLSTYYDSGRELKISESVKLFNENGKLKLTDYSQNTLTAFITFVTDRINNRHLIEKRSDFADAVQSRTYPLIPTLLKETLPESEQLYLAAFVSSLSTLRVRVPKQDIYDLVDMIIDNIETNLMIYLKNKEECKKNIITHIASAFYRIKYKFPINNPLLDEIKYKYKSLFNVTKKLFESDQLPNSFKGIRDEEIGFIISYIGAYIFKEGSVLHNSFRVLIACPNGITISKTIQYQLERHFPQLEIIDTISISDLDDYEKEYDYLISTILIESIDNIIVVNPILRNVDLDLISKTIFDSYQGLNQMNIDDLIIGIKKYSQINDEKNLRKFLYNTIFDTNIPEGGSTMLKETLLPNRIQLIKKCDTWQEAITKAAKPLLEQGTINQLYIDAMIDSVYENGPYIVLDDYFALAHARPNEGVNKLSMSMLKLDESVDLLGKEVKIIVVLAATDNKKHLKALSSLTEMFMEKQNVETIINTQSVNTIVNLIEKYS